MRAQTVACFARQWCTDTHFVDAEFVDIVNKVFIKQGALMNSCLLRVGIHNIHGRNTTQDTLAQRFDDFTALDQRFHCVAGGGSAIADGDDQVLRHIN